MGRFKFKPRKDIDRAGQTNAVRAARAEHSIRQGFKICEDDDLDDVNAAGLISDVFHLCDLNGWSVEAVVGMATANWKDER